MTRSTRQEPSRLMVPSATCATTALNDSCTAMPRPRRWRTRGDTSGVPQSASVGERRGRGIAVPESFNTVVAQVAEVTIRRDGSWRVDRVMCAVDCGLAVNPDVIRAQMESGIAYGLTAAMHGAITLQDGVVEQSNFHDYMPLRMNEIPRIGVDIARSDGKPTRVREPATPVIAPAVGHSLVSAAGQPTRSLAVQNH